MNSTNSGLPSSPLDHLEAIISRAGGVTSLAAALGMTEGGVRYWQRRGSVPRQAARLLAYECKNSWGMDVRVEDLTGGQ